MKTYEIEQSDQWTAEIDALLRPAMNADPLCTINTVSQRVAEGLAGLFLVREHGEMVGAFVASVDAAELGRELVIMAAGGVPAPGRSLTRSIVPYFDAPAAARECLFIRAHLNDERLACAMERNGFVRSELVMRKAVAHGRA